MPVERSYQPGTRAADAERRAAEKTVKTPTATGRPGEEVAGWVDVLCVNLFVELSVCSGREWRMGHGKKTCDRGGELPVALLLESHEMQNIV